MENKDRTTEIGEPGATIVVLELVSNLLGVILNSGHINANDDDV